MEKEYPTSVRVSPDGIDQEFYTWDKIDGQQLRAFYSKKTGFYKFGSRRSLIDRNDKSMGFAIDLFMETMVDQLSEVISNNKWVGAIAYLEYYGDKSLAGRHQLEDPKKLKLFDVAIHKQGMLSPKEFLKYFKYCDTPNFLGVKKWNKDFVHAVKSSQLEGITHEGVVGKQLMGNDLIVVKCKTQRWIDAIKQLYSEEIARGIIES